MSEPHPSTELAVVEQPQSDVFADFAVSLEETARRVKMLQQYVREHMTEGEDYGVIPGSTKPTLFKPGAEKLNGVFGLAPHVDITQRCEDYEKNFVHYEVKVTLVNKRTQMTEAEGLGSCNSKERRYARQDAPSIANTVLKMAKKRALIDATLSATRASGLFTQDLEDQDAHQDAPRESTPRQNTRRENAPAASAQPQTRPDGPASPYLTDAQHRAIIAIAGRVFGHQPTAEDFAPLISKPLEELTKGEASALIDRLRFRLAEQQGHGGEPGARDVRQRSTLSQRDGRRRNTARGDVSHEGYARQPQNFNRSAQRREYSR